jgi:hypothetical protein
VPATGELEGVDDFVGVGNFVGARVPRTGGVDGTSEGVVVGGFVGLVPPEVGYTVRPVVPGVRGTDGDEDDALGDRSTAAVVAPAAAQTAMATNANTVLRENFSNGFAALLSWMSVHCYVVVW